MNMLNLPKKVYFKKGSMCVAFKEIDEVYHAKRAFIISDANLYRLGAVAPVTDFIRGRGIMTAEFFTIDAEPTFENVRSGLPKMLEYQPDFIIGVGGGSVMNVAKAMWLLYENPDLDLNEAAKNFGTLAAEEASFPTVGNKAKLALLATTTATGAECSPFIVLKNDAGEKCVIASYKLLPEIACVDSDYSESMSPDLTKKSGQTALTQAVRAYVSEYASEYTEGIAREAVGVVFKYLEDAVKNGAKAPVAYERLSYAAVLAGIALSNAAPTIDPNAVFYPTEDEKSADKIGADALARIVDLAKHAGIKADSDKKVFEAWIAACEAINSL